jgi:putative ABC transport system permease protein
VHAVNGPMKLDDRGSRWLGAVGRLREGITLDAAQRDVNRVATQLAQDFPQSNKDRGVQLFSLRDNYLGTTRALVLALFAAVGLFLLIACANIVGLQLVRATGRRREIALRMAIGADRGRVVQQLVIEGLVLAIAGAIVGFAVSYFALDGLTALVPAGLLPTFAKPSMNLAAFGFTLATAAVCGILFGIVPALRTSRIALVDSLKQGARDSAAGFGGRRRLGSQQVLVVAETAIALVLLAGAGLFVRSLSRQLSVDPGFNTAGVTRARVSLPQRYTPAMRLQFIQQLEQRLSSAPSVRGVAVASDLPLGGGSSAAFIYVPEAEQSVRFYRHSVTPSYFSTLGVKLVRGRLFGGEDRDGSPAVVIINDAMARRFWNGADPIGKRLRLGDAKGPEATIVGVVGDTRFRDLTTSLATSEPDVYFPMAQRPAGAFQVAISAAVPSEQIADALRREIGNLDRSIPLFGAQSMERLLAQQTASGRFASSILSVFAGAALLLSAVGIYGVLAFLVSLRRREIGIRLALGATNTRVLRGIMGQGVGLAAIGLAIGVVAAMLATRAIESQLYSVGARDPFVFATVSFVLLGVSALASLIPARRAAQVDPQVALKEE